MRRYLTSRIPTLVDRPRFIDIEDDEDEQATEPAKKDEKKPRERLADLAFVADLDAAMELGQEVGPWIQGTGIVEPRMGPGEVEDRAIISSRADVVFFLSRDLELTAQAANACKKAAAGRRAPTIFCGPISTDEPDAALNLAGTADGLVFWTPPREEIALEAEALRRCSATIGERLLLSGEWRAIPQICLTGSPQVLAVVSPSVVEWALLEVEPSPRAMPGGTVLVCLDSETRPWWAAKYATVGPRLLVWRPWMR